MSDKLPTRVLNAIHNGHWAIMPDKLDSIIEVASRKLCDKDAVLSIPAVKSESGNLKIRDGVAILNVGGVIIPHGGLFTEWSGGTSVDTLALRFGEALNDSNVEAIVLHIDSPGGNITGINEFANQIYAARGQKPIYAYISGTGASAAYWIASAADKIIADETAMIGSIGVVASWSDYSEMDEKAGIKNYEIVSSQSPNKRLDPNSKEGKSALQRELDGLADIFIEAISRNRGTNSVYVQDNYGKGGVLLATDAVKVGMADSLGSLEGIINSLSKGESFMKDDELEEKNAVQAVASASKAEENTSDEEDEEEEEEDTEGKNESKEEEKKAALLAKNPELYNAIKLDGVMQERKRMKAICNIANNCGYTDLVKNAMFGNPVSAGKLALQILQAENGTRADLSAKLVIDTKELDGVAASAAIESAKDKDDKDVKAIVSGLQSAGCQVKEVK